MATSASMAYGMVSTHIGPLQAETLQIFTNTLETFCEKLSQEDAMNFRKIKTLVDLEMAIKDIEEEQARRKSFRNLAKIRPLLKTLRQYTEVIEVFVSSKPDILAFIWGPIKFCLQAAVDFDKAFDILLDNYRKISDSLPHVSAIESLFHVHPHVQLLLAHVYKDILTFHERAVAFFKRRGWKIALLTTRSAFETLFEDVIQNLDRSKNFLLTSAHVAHFQEAQDHRSFAEQEFQRQRRHEQAQRKLAVIQWLKAVDHKTHQYEQRRKFAPGTTSWLFDEFAWREWYYSTQETAQLFWISGIPGAGKTVLFSSIVEHILQRNSNKCEIAILFFYCKYGDSARDDYGDVTRSLIAQLLQDNQNCLDYLYDRVLSSNQVHAETIEEYGEIIHAMVQCYRTIYIGIDGLDECEPSERKTLLDILHSLLQPSATESNVKIFISSCAEKDIERSLSNAIRLELVAHHLQSDIHIYVQERVQRMNERFNFDDKFLCHITATVAGQSAGMFLLSRLIMDTLQDLGTRGEVKEELEDGNLPEGIDQAYGRILKRIQGHKSRGNRNRAKLILELLTSAQCTLQLHEIQGILSIDLIKRDVDFENRAYMDHLKVLCGPILEVTETGAVELVHTTAKRYLEECTHTYITSTSAQQEITRYCVNYLAFDCFELKISDSELMDRVKKGEYGFQDYSVGYWMSHLIYMKTKNGYDYPSRSQLLAEAHNLLTSRYRSLSESITSTHEEDSMVYGETSTWDLLHEVQETVRGIEFGSVIGFGDDKPRDADTSPEIFKQIYRTRTLIETAFESAVEHPDRTNLRRVYGFCPFKCPVISCIGFHEGFPSREKRDNHYKKHLRPFKCSHSGCDYQSIGFSSQKALTSHTALSHHYSTLPHRFANMRILSVWESLEDAIDQNDASTVRELCLEVKGLPDRPTGFVMRAVIKGHVEVVKVLVQIIGCSNEYYHTDKRGNTALSYASESGNVELCRLLLANSNLDGYPSRASIDYTCAASKGHLEVLRVWNEYIENAGNYLRYISVAMSSAASAGHTDVALFLMETFTRQNANSEKSRWIQDRVQYAINAAAARRHKTTVRAMLGKSLDSDIWKGFTKLLKVALEKDLDTATNFLIARHDGSLQSNGKTFRNMLQAAASRGKDDEIRRLLAQGADINNPDGNHGTPLQAAAKCGRETTVRLLLDQGASTAVLGGTHGTCLAAAIVGNHRGVAVMLLEAGADVNQIFQTQKEDLPTVLHVAVHNAEKDTIQLLLEFNANLELKDRRGKTPVIQAAESGRKEIVKLLLDYGADPKTLLHFAAASGSTEIVQLLIEQGTDLELTDDSGQTALNRVATTSHETTIRILLEHGANLETTDMLRETPLYRAVRFGSCRIAQLLIEKGADMQVKSMTGATLLHEAVLHNSEETVQMLLENGADPQATTNKNQTPLALSLERRQENIARLLIEKEKDIRATGRVLLHWAIYHGLEEIMQLLIEKGADVHARSASSGSTLLHYAIAYPHEEVIRILLDRGIDIHAKTAEGDTALHRAVFKEPKDTSVDTTYNQNRQTIFIRDRQTIPVLQLLLSYGADINARNNAGKTPLHGVWYQKWEDVRNVSVTYYYPCAIAVAQTLLRHGANIDAEDNEGISPRELALAFETPILDQVLQYQDHEADESL